VVDPETGLSLEEEEKLLKEAEGEERQR